MEDNELVSKETNLTDVKLVGELSSDEWWEQYHALTAAIEEELDECGDTDSRIKLLNLQKAHLELGAKACGVLKPVEGGTTNNILVLAGEQAMDAIRRVKNKQIDG